MKWTIGIFLILVVVIVPITAFWGTVSSTIFPNTIIGLYNKDFWENFLVEAHGAIFDLAVVGIALLWFEERRKKKDKIGELTTNLDDLKHYYGEDASYRTFGQMKRLMALNVTKFEIPEAKLSNLTIQGLNFKSCNFHAVNFTKSRLENTTIENSQLDASIFVDSTFKHMTLTDVSLRRAKFAHAKLKGVDLRNSVVTGADFRNADLSSANFSGVDCKGVNFKGANLRSANFKGARNLTKDMLLEAENVKFVKTDFDL
ncbi:hypothetical protein BBM65_01520 [Vibrio parahaemolyticus]|uniref:pentapeptide repeat-containing protein n=3 Tax=Vibrio parahaemolyticus TaxID=670 RepID=UPI00084AF831|nr:pentapeptide repeat-containing protein [Vibrio parahaemolyticus]OEA61728.1 hypothetical protein BBM65_01520 [Vibrio parahaemolyticus]OEA68901.1 hypothetical protein BBM66_04495 [Vibrio parahaemolyticus]TOD47236.1 pentapeptide repeat-containing protein [Vibrio parahaemolyticus]